MGPQGLRFYRNRNPENAAGLRSAVDPYIPEWRRQKLARFVPGETRD
jgi:hypothetical protein